MAHVTPQVQNKVLTLHKGTNEEQSIPVESEVWWHWLSAEETRTFYYGSEQGSFTARRERKSGGWYWYAYRKQYGKLHKAYLGKAEELVQGRLEAIAAHLAAQARPDAQVDLPDNHTERISRRIQQHILLTTRLHQPPARLNLVSRPRLIKHINAGFHTKLTLISAPAGFGKTTLLADWCSTHQPHISASYAWLSLDASDNDLIHFWTYVVAALQTISPALARQVEPLLPSLSIQSAESLLTVLINALNTITREIVLILDDYHLITAPAIHETLTFLLDHLPLHAHLIIASRTDPPLPLVRWRAQGQLNELHTTDLRFINDEVALFLNQVMGLHLSGQQIASLDTHTEGWVAGLQLAALSLQGRTDIENFLATFTGSHRHILDYLTGEVLQRQPEPVRTFLLQTSILERLSASLCDAVTQRNDGQAMLEHLEQANLFLIPLDEERHWYRYHHLFAEFLRDRLRQAYPDLLPTLHQRASEWYEHYGLIATTMDHALAAGNMEYAATLAERFAPIMLQRGEIVTLLRWIGLLPAEILRLHPDLRLYQAGSLVSTGQLDQASSSLHEAEETLNQLKETVGEASSEYRKVASEFFAVATSLAAFRGDLEQALAYSRQASELIPPEDMYTRSMLAASLGTAYIFHGDFVAANRVYQEAIEMGTKAQHQLIVLTSIAGQGYLQATYGHLRQAVETYQRTIQLGTRAGGRLFSAVSMAYVCLSDILYEWNRLEEAERYAREGIELGRPWGYVGMLGLGYHTLARIQQARGKHEEALSLIQQAEQQVQTYTLQPITTMIAAVHAQIALRAGHIEKATQWVQSIEQGLLPATQYFSTMKMLVQAQLSLVQGQLSQASEIIQHIIPQAEAVGDMRTIIESLLIQAIVLHRQENSDQALAALTRALVLAEPEGYIRIFIDKGEPIISLLHQAAARGIRRSYTHTLLQACREHIATTSSPLGDQLSERELHIVHLIAAGKSNQEIAHELTIALSTVKTHINNLYTKLGVHSRTQAIAQAKEMHLLF